MKRGFTTIELLIALAIVGVLASLVFPSIRPPEARLMANEVKAMLQQARYESIKRNQPVAFVWLPDSQSFRTRFDSATSTVPAACVGDTQIAQKDVAEYRAVEVRVTGLPTNGVVWLPTGQARTCTGAPMVNSEIEIESGGVVVTVEATMGGKVTIK